MPYDDLYEYQKQGDDTIYKFLASSLKENNDILPEIEDKQPYLYRATSMPDGSILYVREKLIGASAAVNQLAKNGNFVNTDYWSAGRGIRTVSNNVLTLTADGTALFTQIYQDINIPINHKVLVRYTYDFSSSANIERTNLTYTNGTDYLNAGYSASNKGVNEFIFNPTLNVTRMQFVFTNTHSVSLTASDSGTFKNIQVIDLTQMFGTAIADLAYSKEQASAGSGIAWLKSYGFFTKEYYPYNTGALQSVKTGSKKVVGFNQWDEEWESGVWKTYSGGDGGKQDNENYVRSKNMIPVLPNTQYYFVRTVAASDNRFGYYDKDGNYLGFDAGFGLGSALSILVTTPANAAYITFYFKGDSSVLEGICWNISDESKNGTYEPYTSTTYPLDSNLELRGLYKLDSNNNIVCDGDEYTPDGSVKRRYGIVDLGSLDWINQVSSTSRKYWRAIDSSIKSISNNTIPSIICSKPYNIVTAIAAYNDNTSSSLITSGDSHNVEIYDETYASSTSDQFKAAMSGVYLIYELATETTDSADSYQNPQIIHENGTEEFIDTRDYPLPVGHDTEYFTASDEKFFLPPIVDNDGRFLYHDGDGFQFKNFNQVASKVEESDINGNIKIDGTETQVYDDSELQGIVDTDTTVATGNPLNFSTKSAQNAVNTDIVIDPVQDLHGYSKPWVGGAGKNLLPMTVDEIKSLNIDGIWTGNSYLYKDVTWTILVDNDNNVIGIKANGKDTTAYSSTIVLGNVTLKANTTYILNGCPSDGGGSKYRIYPYGKTSEWYDEGNGKTLPIQTEDATITLLCAVYRDYQASNLIYYPMLRLSTVSDATFEPYTNICPISPKEQIAVQGCGKNLFNPNSVGVQDAYLRDDGTISTPEIHWKITDYISVIPNSVMSFSFDATEVGNSPSICWYDKDKNFLGGKKYANQKIATFLLPNNAIYVRASYYWRTWSDNAQLEYGYSRTDYSSYTPSNNLQIPLPNDFYGGTLNLESGELVVDRGYAKLAALTYDIYSVGTATCYLRSSIIANAISQNNSSKALCSAFSIDKEHTSVDSQDANSMRTANQRLFFKTRLYSTTSEFITAMANEIAYYELETKYTVHLTPHQLNLLKATNNISTDAKTISVTYRNGELSTYAPATDIADGLLTATDKRAIDRTSEITKGNPIQFSTESKQIARSTIIDLEPIQDLHGYSKPWVGGAGKNLLPMTVEGIKAVNSNYTWNGNVCTVGGTLTFTILTDADNNVIGIKVNGSTSSSIITFMLVQDYINIEASQNLILNGYDGHGWDTIYLQALDNDSSNYTTADGEITIPSGKTVRYVRIRVPASHSVSNIMIYPMLRKSSDSATFEPYTNIASISGYDEVDINGCGENIWDAAADATIYGWGGTWTRNGQTYSCLASSSYVQLFSENGDVYQASHKVRVEPNATYNFSIQGDTVTKVYFIRYDKFGNFVSYANANLINNVANYIIPANTFYIGIRLDKSDAVSGTTYSFTCQLNLGSQVTLYEPYTESNNISIQLDNTVYGGKLDVEKGELVVDRAIVDLGDLTWDDLGTAVSGAARFKTTLTNKPVRSDLTNGSTSYCSHYDLLTDGGTYTANKDGYTISTTDIVFFVDAYKTSSTSAFKTAMNGVQVVYTLQDEYKTTIKLTPHQIDLLKGVNTITTNADSITLQYRNGEVATLEDLKILSDNLIAHTEDTEPYGFIEHMSILDPAQRIEYIGKNKNYKPVTVNLSGDHLANYNDWHDFFVLKENKPYMIKADGTVDYALDPNDYTKKFDGSASDIADTTYTGGAFSWIPKIYKYEYVEGSDRYVYFSQKKLNDNYEAIGFIDENGLEHDGAWIPMFYGTEITQDGTVKIMSLATGTPSQSRDTTTQKTYIENFSSQAKFFGGPIVNVLADLLIMLGKNSDIQAVFGTGNMSGGNGTQYMKANACLNGGAFYGSSTNTALNKAFHSLVLLTQNSYQRDPYTILVNGTLKVSPYYKYDITGATYQDTGITYPATSSAWEYPHKSISVPHWGAVPDKGPYSGSTTTGWADGFYKNVSSTRVGFRFAACTNGRVGGPRCLDLGGAASYASWHIGASALLFSEGKSK